MSQERREKWSQHIEQVIRSKRYTWLAEGLSGEPLENALTEIITDVMHICKREGLSWDNLSEASRMQFVREERQTPARREMAGAV